MAEPKIVITGTGRAGTTVLVRILDALGLDTGIDTDKLSPYMPGVRAGLESRVDDPDAPTVVKDMTLGFRMRRILESGEVAIEHVLIPTRRLEVAVASRVRAADYGRQPFRRGALTGTLHATEQEQVLVKMRDEIVGALRDFAVPYTTLEFPRFATDAAYAHGKLATVVPGATVDDVQSALDRCVRPDLIHEDPLSPQERWRMRATVAWMRLVRYPVANVRRRINPEAAEARLRASYAAARERDRALAEAERAVAEAAATDADSGGDRPPAAS
ncbi:MAG TPA: hypothetical protein VHI95_09745 [Acidimicrobiales bacterium]|jgi:hypothetical protein|nr:hypothetical protein [Acidimicrobiales bacterium]